MDIIADEINYSIKSNIGNNPAGFNYSKNTTFAYKVVNVTDEEMEELDKKIKNETISKGNALLELINKNKIEIDPEKYIGKIKPGEKGFKNFLKSIDEELPRVLIKVMYEKTKTSKMEVVNLLDKNDLKIFQKFMYCIGQGLTVSNYESYIPIELYEISFDKELNYKINKFDKKYIDDSISRVVIDRGSSKRTGFGTIYKENNQWYFVDDLYIRYK